MSTDRIKSMIRQCFAVIENAASTEGEKEAAYINAQRLMDKHNLEREDCHQRDDGTIDASKVQCGRSRWPGCSGRRIAWESMLCRIVCKLFPGVQYYTSYKSCFIDAKGNESTRSTWWFYGPQEDQLAAGEMFDELRRHIQDNAVNEYGGFAKGDGARFAQGFCAGFAERLEKCERQRLQSADSDVQTLALRSQETVIALQSKGKDWLAAEHGVKLSRGAGMGGSGGGGSSYRAGVSAGRSASTPARRNSLRLS